MILFTLPDGQIDHLERGAYLTPPFDLSFILGEEDESTSVIPYYRVHNTSRQTVQLISLRPDADYGTINLLPGRTFEAPASHLDDQQLDDFADKGLIGVYPFRRLVENE